ncbi:MAG: PAS domain S-box protein [Fodinibius sp.]|nr:PAS domain S-box protein [Fodinibius sp.]
MNPKHRQQAYHLAGIGYWELDLQNSKHYWYEKLYWSDNVKHLHEVPLDYQPTLEDAVVFYEEGQNRQKIQAAVENAIKNGESYAIESKIITAEGNHRWVRSIGEPVFKHGQCIKLYGSTQDITNRKSKELKIKAQQKELQMFLENSLDGIMITSPDGSIHRANKAMCEMLGMEEGEILTLGRDGLVYNDQKLQEALKRRRETGKFSGELTFIHKSGKKIPVELTTSVYTTAKGEPRTSMVIRDISEREQTKQKLEKSLERYHYATKATYDAIWDWDLTDDTLYWGEGFETLFGYDLETLSSDISSWTSHIHPDDRDWVYQSIKKAIAGTEQHWTEEYRYLNADGNYSIVEDRGYIIRNSENEATRMIGAMRDVTERRELKNLLDQAYSMARIGAWEIDLEKDTVYWSPITKEIHEVEPNFEPDLETGISFYKEGKSRAVIKEAVKKAIEDGTSWDEELQIVTAKGNERWVRAKGEPEIIEGQCRRIYGVFQDIHERKQAQIKMLDALQERQRILERITEAFFAVDEDWTVTYWNSMAEEIIGVARSEVLGQNLWVKFPEAKDLKFIKQYRIAFEEQKTVSFQEYYPPLEAWLEVQAYPSEDGLSIFFRDITDRKRDQLELEKAYQEKETILESIGDGFFTVNKDWNVTYWNSAAEEMLETPKEVIVGKNLWDVFSDATDLPSYTDYHRAMEERVSINFKDYWEHLDRWFDISVYPSAEGISVYFKDITEQKEREKQLREINRKDQLILESTAEGIYGIDTEGNCTFINGAASKMLGYRSEECIGENMHELIHHKYGNGEHYPESECPIFVSKNNHENCRVVDGVFWRADGSCFDVEYTSNPMIEDGEIKGAVVTFSDITERKQHERALKESLKEKETLLLEIHHRVKNNLAVVSGMMQLQAFEEGDEAIRRKLTDSVNRIQTMGTIHELLYQSESFSSLEFGKNIKKLVTDISQTFQAKIDLDITFDLETITLNINQAVPVSLIINEVVTNVFKHAFDENDQGTLRVKMRKKNNSITLQISDNGKGLPPDFHISKHPGSLGLQLIVTLSQQLEGNYNYESKKGKTHFVLTFKKADVKGSSNTLGNSYSNINE